MQIKTMDGVVRDVSPVELQHAYKEAHKDEYKQVAQVDMHHFIKKVKEQACEYKQKASQNLKRIAELDSYPTTEDDVKSAISKAIRYGSSAQAADAIYEAVEFEAARFVSHLMSKFME